MSASVTVSIAEERIGMLSEIPRLSWVRVSAWLGSTEDSSGCSRTSSNVRPRGMSEALLGWAISAHGRASAIRQGAGLAGRPIEHALSRLDVHPLDHLVAETLRTTVKGIYERTRALDVRRAWREGPVAELDLVGMNQALAVEAEPAAVLRLGEKAIRVVEAVEHAVERRDAGGPRRKNDPLERCRDRLARGI